MKKLGATYSSWTQSNGACRWTFRPVRFLTSMNTPKTATQPLTLGFWLTLYFASSLYTSTPQNLHVLKPLSSLERVRFLTHLKIKSFIIEFFRDQRFEGPQPNREFTRSGAGNAVATLSYSIARSGCKIWEVAPYATFVEDSTGFQDWSGVFSKDNRQHSNGKGALRYVQKLIYVMMCIICK